MIPKLTTITFSEHDHGITKKKDRYKLPKSQGIFIANDSGRCDLAIDHDDKNSNGKPDPNEEVCQAPRAEQCRDCQKQPSNEE